MLTVVIQGNITRWTYEFARLYQRFPEVSEVIISTWKGEDIRSFQDFLVLQSDKPVNPGYTNRNLQIVSSLVGAKLSKTLWTLKVRSDMFLPHLSEMFKFAILNHTEKVKAFTLSVFKNYPFHPKDHAFLGKTKDIVEIFDIPLCDSKFNGVEDYNNNLRSEAYIGQFSYAKYVGNIDYMINNKKYLCDNRTNNQADKIYQENIFKQSVFVPFPRYNIVFPKHHPNGYPFDIWAKVHGEMYYEDINKLN